MSETDQESRVFVAMPGYGRMTAAASRALWFACEDVNKPIFKYQCGSLLAMNFNLLWCTALNQRKKGIPIKYFAMLHDDVGPRDFWLDQLIEELEAQDLDMLGVVVPIKDENGLTSIALDRNEVDTWRPLCRLTMDEIYRLPETFTEKDTGYPILLNTGCWVCRFDQDWNDKVYFTINDRIIFDKVEDKYQAQVESEDWFFSRLCHEQKVRIGCTRKIPLRHTGMMEFPNDVSWGRWKHDEAFMARSVLDPKFPYDVDGWLSIMEGEKLAELATGKRVLEIGSYCGRSTIYMARTAREVVSVDPHDSRGTPGDKKNTLAEFQANLERYGVREKVKPNVCTVRCFTDGQDLTRPENLFDLIFIDGAHDYESVKSNIEDALLLLADDGLLAFHDYHMEVNPGVSEAVDELISTGADLLSLDDTLAVIRPAIATYQSVLNPAVHKPSALVTSEV